jgi:ABC-type phosphate transport system substrate-binding protein
MYNVALSLRFSARSGCLPRGRLCGGGSSAASEVAADLHGAGASFPAPLYDRWFKDFVRAHPNLHVDYQSVGSGAGIT